MFDITRNWFEIFIRPDNMKYSQSAMRTIHSNITQLGTPLPSHCLKKKKMIKASSNYFKKRNSFQGRFLVYFLDSLLSKD